MEEELSEWEEVSSEVIQGSVLGGILFIMYVNDIDEAVVGGLTKKFADDTKVAKVVETEEEGEQMQETINNLVGWAKKWEMEFNAAKCKIIHCGRNNKRRKYYMGEEQIGETGAEKDLGVWVEESMKPARQCAAAAKGANFALGQLTRAFHYRRKSNLIPLYKTFIRPRLEFAAAAWNPWTETDSGVLEKVQERMIRSMSDVRGRTYEEKYFSL